MQRCMTVVGVLAMCSAAAAKPSYRSHPPMRALPTASTRPLDNGPTYCVDADKGDDGHDGSKASPFKTINEAVKHLKPGDTLCLRGGTYYEHVVVSCAGEATRPITIRSYPGELAVIDGGIREFMDSPAQAWEPAKDGVPGEYQSVKVYPGLGKVLGNFGDSMVPLHGYRNLIDLRSTNEYWNLKEKLSPAENFYCGPGIGYDAQTGRLHARLAHYTLDVLGDNRYLGETDPRKLPLVIAGAGVALRITEASHVRIRDVVVRGAADATIRVDNADDVELDGVTAFGGSPGLLIEGTRRLRVLHSAIRGLAAPWSSRAGMKYRGTPSYLLIATAAAPYNRETEIADTELTDSHDGPFIGTIKGLRFHHNLVDNCNDDGIYLTAEGVGGDVQIYENHLSRCLTMFAFYGEFPPGGGVSIYRNVIDLRGPVHYHWPRSPDDPAFKPEAGGPSRFPSAGSLCGDHGGPVWEPMAFYHNTVIARKAAFRNYYGLGMGGHVSSRRKVYNNIFVQIEGNPGLAFGVADGVPLDVDGNLLWGTHDGPAAQAGFFESARQTTRPRARNKQAPARWGEHDRFADPRFGRFSEDNGRPLDLSLRPDSPAIDAGAAIPSDWPDPFRERDRGKPDIGALPRGVAPSEFGPRPTPSR